MKVIGNPIKITNAWGLLTPPCWSFYSLDNCIFPLNSLYTFDQIESSSFFELPCGLESKLGSFPGAVFQLTDCFSRECYHYSAQCKWHCHVMTVIAYVTVTWNTSTTPVISCLTTGKKFSLCLDWWNECVYAFLPHSWGLLRALGVNHLWVYMWQQPYSENHDIFFEGEMNIRNYKSKGIQSMWIAPKWCSCLEMSGVW